MHNGGCEFRLSDGGKMADGKWVMTSDDAKRVDLTFSGANPLDFHSLPNYGKIAYVDDRAGDAAKTCAHCGSDDLDSGFGGSGEGFAYRSVRCRKCGGTTKFVYRDEAGRFFK